MALSFSTSFVASGGPSPRTLLYPSGMAVDDLMLLQVVTSNDVVPVVPGGFQLIAEITGTFRTGVYQKVVDEYDLTLRLLTVTWASGNGTIGFFAINASTLAYPVVHQTNTASSDSASTNKVWNGVTNTDADTLLLCFGGFGTGADSLPHSGMTERWDTNTPRMYLMTEAVAATGATGTRTATGNSVASQKCITISISETDTFPITYAEEEWVTEFPVLLEIGSEGGEYVTQFPVYAEFAAVGIYLTQFGVFTEFEYVEPSGGIVPVVRPANAGTRALHKILPNEVTGYAFDPEYSWWTIVVPEATENLIGNPSFEVYDVEGYDEVTLGWASTDVVDNAPVGATRGLRCMRLEANTIGNGEFFYKGMLETGELTHVMPGAYTWSLDLYVNKATAIFELEIRYAGGSTITKRRFTGVESGWKRYEMTYIEAGVGDIELVIRNISFADDTFYYTDAWQLEKKRYATTYCDGDMVGFYDTYPTQSYYWKGKPHHSPTVRRANTASGGRELSLSDEFGLYTTAIIGLGMGPVEHEIQELASGKELFRGSHDLPRDFTITAKLFGENWSSLSFKRNELIKLLRPNNTPEREPLLLRYQPTDDKGLPYGVPLEIICAYSSGLQGNITNLYQETLPMQFHASLPFLSEIIESQQTLLLQTSLTASGLFYRDADMEYQLIEAGTSGGDDFGNVSLVDFGYGQTCIAAIEVLSDTGDLQFAGILRDSNIMVASQDSSGNYQWDSFGTDDMTTGTFQEMAVNDGFFVIVGDLTKDDGINEWHNIVVFLQIDGLVPDPGAIIINNIDEGLNDIVYAVESHQNGTLYVGGAFDDEYGVVGTDRPGFFRLIVDPTIGEAFAQDVLGGVGGIVYAIKSDGYRYVYVGGNFPSAYNSPGYTDAVGANNIIIYDTLLDQWIPMGTVNYIGVNGDVGDIEIAPDGTVYIIGDFLSYASSLIPLNKIGRWNGYTWEQPFDFGTLFHGDLHVPDVRFKIAPDGILWFFSRDIDAGFLAVPTVGDCHMFGWKDGIFYAPPYQNMGANVSQAVSDLKFLPNGEMLLSYRELGTSMRVPYLNRVNYYGGADAYPTVILTSAHPQFIINHSVDAAIYFKSDAILNNLERMQIALSSVRANIFSNMRTDLSTFIQSGATNISDFRLLPGENRVSVFVREAITGDEGAIVWRNTFWSMDATVANELQR